MSKTGKNNIVADIAKHKKSKENAELLSNSLKDLKEKYKSSEYNTKEMVKSADQVYEDYKKELADSLIEIDPEITPIGMAVITTARLMSYEESGEALVQHDFDPAVVKMLSKAVSKFQKVMAIGKSCQDVKVGDEVCIDLQSFNFKRVENPNSVNRKEVNVLPTEEINGRTYLSVHERDIKFIMHKKQV